MYDSIFRREVTSTDYVVSPVILCPFVCLYVCMPVCPIWQLARWTPLAQLNSFTYPPRLNRKYGNHKMMKILWTRACDGIYRFARKFSALDHSKILSHTLRRVFIRFHWHHFPLVEFYALVLTSERWIYTQWTQWTYHIFLARRICPFLTIVQSRKSRKGVYP